MSRKLYRVEIDYRQGGATGTLRFATEPINRPVDGGGRDFRMDGRLTQLVFRQSAFAENTTRGEIVIGSGAMVLENRDGGLDYIKTSGYIFDNQPFRIYSVDSETDVDTFFWSGICESAFLDEKELTLTIRDVSYQMDTVFQPTRYAGTNALPAGLEGTAADIKGKVKPVVVGSVFNASPPLVNTSRLIYHLTHGFPRWIEGFYTLTVYDSGVPLTLGVKLPLLSSLDFGFTALTFTVNTATDVFTTAANGYITGTPLTFTSSASLPAPLVSTSYYYARVLSSTTFTVHPTAADASANTNIVDITSAGSGTMDVAKNRTAPGCYDYFNDYIANPGEGVFIRLGSKAVGQVTFDFADQGNRNLDENMYQVLNRLDYIIGSRGLGVPLYLENVIVVESSPAPAISNQVLGLYVSEPTTFHSVMQDLVSGLNCFFFGYPSITSNADPTIFNYQQYAYLIVNRIKYPIVDTPVFTLTESNVVTDSMRVIVPADPERGVPAWRVNVQYQRNETVQTANEIPGAGTTRQAFAATEYRTTVAQDTTTRTNNPMSPEIEFTAKSLTDATGAANLATYLRDMYKQYTDIIAVKVPLDDWFEISTTLAPTNSVLLPDGTGPYPGSPLGFPIAMDSALRFARTRSLIGYQIDLASNTVELTLWG